MSESFQSRLWEDVSEGEVLPKLEFPITVKTLILGVCGTRDLMPYHHDPAYSKSVGNRDMFVNTMFDQALFARYATDWSGPDSDFRASTLQMLGQLSDLGRTITIAGSRKMTRRSSRWRIRVHTSRTRNKERALLWFSSPFFFDNRVHPIQHIAHFCGEFVRFRPPRGILRYFVLHNR